MTYLPATAKEEPWAITPWLLEQSQVAGVLAGYERVTWELTSLYTRQLKKAEQSWQKTYDDLRDRVAQVVVRSAAELNRTSRRPEIAPERDTEGPEPEVRPRAEERARQERECQSGRLGRL